MKINFKLILVAVLMVGTSSVQAQQGFPEARDFSLDVFGYHASRDKGGADREAWGPGVGVNYFFSRYFGVGADTYADAFEVPYLLNASALARYPLGDIAAPYAFTGFGRQWEHAAQWTGHLGGGIEARIPFILKETSSAFVDIRQVFAAETHDYTVIRFGFRLRF